MRKVAIVFAALAVVGLVWASNPCTDLVECARAAEEFCDTIHDEKADSAQIVEVAMGDECRFTCAGDLTVHTMKCFGPS